MAEALNDAYSTAFIRISKSRIFSLNFLLVSQELFFSNVDIFSNFRNLVSISAIIPSKTINTFRFFSWIVQYFYEHSA